MSMYNMLFGVNHFADVFLAMLGLKKEDVPRFRDCYVSKEGQIVIYTRTGGDNRGDYEKENDFLTTVKGYLGDEDDDFDCTYAYFRYEVSKGANEVLEEIKLLGGSDNPNKKWTDTLDKMKSKNPDRAMKELLDRMAPIMEKILKIHCDKCKKTLTAYRCFAIFFGLWRMWEKLYSHI